LHLLYKWRKQVSLVVLISLLITAGIVFIMPSQYLASSTALPANPVSADKSTIFNENIRDFYNSIGQPGDLDKIVGTGQLDTIYLAVAAEYNLADYYKISKTDPLSLHKAAVALKKDSRITKSEYGELLVQVWNRDRAVAPQLANALMEKLSAIHQELMNKSNQAIIKSLQHGKQKLLNAIDSINQVLLQSTMLPTQAQIHQARLTVLQQQLIQYEKLETEYQLMADTRPSALMIVDKARPAVRPDKPRRLLILLAAAILSFLFATWLALLLERRKTQMQ
jgi:uncharacterized protein involved in exopolysaccharide biosynthesis